MQRFHEKREALIILPKPRPANVFKLAEAVGVQLPGAPAQLYLDIMAGEFQWGEFAKSPENEIEEVKQKIVTLRERRNFIMDFNQVLVEWDKEKAQIPNYKTEIFKLYDMN